MKKKQDTSSYSFFTHIPYGRLAKMLFIKFSVRERIFKAGEKIEMNKNCDRMNRMFIKGIE